MGQVIKSSILGLQKALHDAGFVGSIGSPALIAQKAHETHIGQSHQKIDDRHLNYRRANPDGSTTLASVVEILGQPTILAVDIKGDTRAGAFPTPYKLTPEALNGVKDTILASTVRQPVPAAKSRFGTLQSRLTRSLARIDLNWILDKAF